MGAHQILNEKKQNLIRNKQQNLNKLFYDIGWRVSKYVDGLQQIVSAANQLETMGRHRALTQLGQVSSMPPESPNSALLPHLVHHKARTVPESYVALDHAFTLGTLVMPLSIFPFPQVN